MNSTYVLMSAAKNEARFIGKTIESVASQTVLPISWVIVDDGSTDETSPIIVAAQKKYPFITLLTNTQKRERHFGAKAHCLQIAFEALKNLSYDFIGNLDADVSFEPSFYESLLTTFELQPKLGISGGVIWEERDGAWQYSYSRPSWCVGGATHFFRAKCFTQIGNGYPALRYGGEDTIVEYLARSNGWVVSANTDCKVYHYKPSVSLVGKPLKASYKMGIQEYHWGTGFLFELFKCLVRLGKRPYLVDGVMRFAGYLSQCFAMRKPDLSNDIAKIVRKQQLKRMVGGVAGMFRKNTVL